MDRSIWGKKKGVITHFLKQVYKGYIYIFREFLMYIYVQRLLGFAPDSNNAYSALKPLTCRILICFTMVLFPDSPAPVRKKAKQY